MNSTTVVAKRTQKQSNGDEIFELLQFNRRPGKILEILNNVEEGRIEVDFQQKYEKGHTLLDEAIRSSDSFRNSESFIEIAIKLIQLDKDNYMIGYINPTGAFKGTTPLIVACYRKLGKIALEMIKKGEACKPSYQEPELQFTALMYACWSCRAEVAIELMKIITPESICLTSHTGNTALMYACTRIDLTDVKEITIIKEIIPVMKEKCPELIGHVDNDGYTALMILCNTYYILNFKSLQKENIELALDALIKSGYSNPGYVNESYSYYGGKPHGVTALIVSIMKANYPAAIKLAELPDANVDYIVRNDPFSYAEESFDNITAFDILLSLLEVSSEDDITSDKKKLFNLLIDRYYNYKNSDNAELSTLSDRYIRVCCNVSSLKKLLVGYFDSKVNGRGETMVKALCESRSKLGNLVAANATPVVREQVERSKELMRPLEVTDSQGREDTVSESPMGFFSEDQVQRMSKIPRLTAQQSYPTAQPILNAYMRPASPSPDDFGQDPRTLQYSDRDGYLRITGPKNPDEDSGPNGGRKYTKRKKSNRRSKKHSTKRKRKSRKVNK